MRHTHSITTAARDEASPARARIRRRLLSWVPLAASALWLGAIALWVCGTIAPVSFGLPSVAGRTVRLSSANGWVNLIHEWVPTPQAARGTRSEIDGWVKDAPGFASVGVERVYAPLVPGRPLKLRRTWMGFGLRPLVLGGFMPLAWLWWMRARTVRPPPRRGFAVLAADKPAA